MKNMPLRTIMHKAISSSLRKRGYSDYAISIVADRILDELENSKKIPLRKRLWALKHGFFCDKFSLYDLNEGNYQDYLSDLDYYWLHPVNGIFSHLIDDKLSLRYLLFPFSEYLPNYYFHISDKGILRLMDCPEDLDVNTHSLIHLLKVRGSLAVKPIIGHSGLGFIKLAFYDEAFYVNDRLSSETEILKLFDNLRLSNSGYIISEYLRPHSAISKIWSKAPNTLRITVIRTSDQVAKIAYANTRFGNSASGVVDNSTAGGLLNLIDIDTGHFSEGKVLVDNRLIACTFHPDTKELVEGTIPGWQAIKKKLIEISDFIPQLSLLGFDVIVEENGFKIIEINSQPILEFLQCYTPINKHELLRPFFEEKMSIKKKRFQNRKPAFSATIRKMLIHPGNIFDKFTKALNIQGGEKKTTEQMALISNSGFFNEKWYLGEYPDVSEAGIAPLRHYLTIGAFEGRDPGPEFSSNFYLNTYDDVKNEGINPLLHYLKYGKAEGRMAHSGLSTAAQSRESE